MGFLDARHLKRRASWPVWSDSTTTPIRFQPMPKKAAVRLWHRARTSIARRASLVATAVLHALGLLNFATGRLDPSYAAIARKANVCERTVATYGNSESFIGSGAVPRAGATGASCWILAGATNPERFSPLARI